MPLPRPCQEGHSYAAAPSLDKRLHVSPWEAVGAPSHQCMAVHAMQHLLRLPFDDARLDRLAAAAVLAEQDACWSNAEMVMQLEDVLRLQETSLPAFEAGGFISGADPLVLEAAALHAAFEQMRQAVRRGLPLPRHEELLVMVARALLKRDFAAAHQVEEAVALELSRG